MTHTSSSNQPGALIVIDGIDGAGKTTQARLLTEALNAHGHQSSYLHFPRYETFFGATIKRFLNGEFGDIDTTSPYLCSIAYALDRQNAASDLAARLERGECVVTDRYVPSNLAHQGARCKNVEDTEAFISWNMQLEYQELGVVHENIVLFLDTPPDTAHSLRAKRSGDQDILENNEDHQQETYNLYRSLASRFDHWHTVPSLVEEAMRPQQDIHQTILHILQQAGIAH